MRTPTVLSLIVSCLVLLGGAGPSMLGARADDITLAVPIFWIERQLRGAEGDRMQRIVSDLTTDALQVLAERCSPVLPDRKRDTLGRAIVIGLRFVPELGIDPYWRSQSIGRYITTVYLQNVFEHHEDLESVQCADGERVASYERNDVF